MTKRKANGKMNTMVRKIAQRGKTNTADKPGMYKRLLRNIAHKQVTYPYQVVAIILAITLIFLGGASKVQTVAALENMMPQDIEEIAAFNQLRDANLGQDMIAIVIKLDGDSTTQENLDILSWENYQYVKKLTAQLQTENNIGNVYSLSAVLESMNGFQELDERTFIALAHSDNSDVHNQLANYVNQGRTNTIIIATTDVSANDEQMTLLADRVIEDVNSLGRPAGTDIALTGTPIIQQELGKLISRDRTVTQNISTLFVFIIVMILFGTFTSALVPIIVVTLSVTWLYGTMGYTGLPISTLAGGVAAMVIGIGIDYAIHLMNKFKYERKRGLTREQSVEAAVVDTGTALTGASVATMLAFIAFLLGSMPEMNRFGLLMTMGVGYSFLLSILALPALLIIEERVFFRWRKRLHFGVEGEFFLATEGEACPPGYTTLEKNPEQALAREVSEKIGEKFTIYHKKASRKKELGKNNAKTGGKKK